MIRKDRRLRVLGGHEGWYRFVRLIRWYGFFSGGGGEVMVLGKLDKVRKWQGRWVLGCQCFLEFSGEMVYLL